MSRVPNTDSRKKARSGFNLVTHGIQGIKGLVSGKLMGRDITDVGLGLQSFAAATAGKVSDLLKLGAQAVKAAVVQVAPRNTMPFSGVEIDPPKPKPGRGGAAAPAGP